jgi:hypothetical protein
VDSLPTFDVMKWTRGVAHSKLFGAEFSYLDHIWKLDAERPEDSRLSSGRAPMSYSQSCGSTSWRSVSSAIRQPNSSSASRIIEKLCTVRMGTLIAAGRDARSS